VFQATAGRQRSSSLAVRATTLEDHDVCALRARDSTWLESARRNRPISIQAVSVRGKIILRRRMAPALKRGKKAIPFAAINGRSSTNTAGAAVLHISRPSREEPPPRQRGKARGGVSRAVRHNPRETAISMIRTWLEKVKWFLGQSRGGKSPLNHLICPATKSSHAAEHQPTEPRLLDTRWSK
jgi:hypothetical protein